MKVNKSNFALSWKIKCTTLTDAEDGEAKAMVDRLVNQLIRHAVKDNRAGKRDSPSTFSLQLKHQSVLGHLNRSIIIHKVDSRL